MALLTNEIFYVQRNELESLRCCNPDNVDIVAVNAVGVSVDSDADDKDDGDATDINQEDAILDVADAERR